MIWTLLGFLMCVAGVCISPAPFTWYCLGVTSMGLVMRIVREIEKAEASG